MNKICVLFTRYLKCVSAFNYQTIASYIKHNKMNRENIDSFHLIIRATEKYLKRGL